MKQTTYVLAMLLLLGLGACKSKQKITEIQPAAPTEKAIEEATTTVEPVETAIVKVEEVEETRAENFKIVSEEPAVPSKYYLVVGSFKNEANAINLQSKLRTEGNKVLIALNENQMYRVIIATFDDYASAKAQKNSILYRFADAWILVKK